MYMLTQTTLIIYKLKQIATDQSIDEFISLLRRQPMYVLGLLWIETF